MMSDKVTPKRLNSWVWPTSIVVSMLLLGPRIEGWWQWVVAIMVWMAATAIIEIVLYVALKSLAEAWDERRHPGSTTA